MVIENEKGKKTYTLFINRKKPRVLENLVFSETETEELSMYVVSYDSILFKGNEITESGNVKNYITLDFLGKKSVSNVFSKMVSCYDSQQIPIFVPGSLCASGQHAYGIVYDPPCSYHGWQAASPDYWSTQYTFTIYACDDGLPEHIFGITPIGGGGSGNPIGPCGNIIKENVRAKELFEKTVVKNRNDSMKATITTDGVEKGFIWGKDSNGNYKVGNIFVGTANGLTGMPMTDPNFVAEAFNHNHIDTGYEVLSAGDLYWFQKTNKLNSFFKYYFSNGYAGSDYVYTIVDNFNFQQLQSNYPEGQYASPDGGWNTASSIGKDAEKVEEFFYKMMGKTDEEAYELAMAYVIGKYGLGVGLSKRDPSTGNFEPIFVKETEITIITGNPLDPNASTITIKGYEKTSNCNLN